MLLKGPCPVSHYPSKHCSVPPVARGNLPAEGNDMKRLSYVLTLLVVTVGMIASDARAQGSLTPTGAPSTTFKTLQQIRPHIDLATVGSGSNEVGILITQPGSYYLTSDLLVTNVYGIQVLTNNVHIDLNGFTIRLTQANIVNLAISIHGVFENFLIENGTIEGDFTQGIEAYASSEPPAATNICVQDVTFIGRSFGIFGAGGAVVRRCKFENVGTGLRFSYGDVLIEDCVMDLTGADGIELLTASGVSVVRNCIISGVLERGIDAPGRSVHLDNVVVESDTFAFTGLAVGPQSVIENCIVRGFQDGIMAGSNSNIRATTVNGSSSEGMELGEGCIVEDCKVFSCTVDGIRLGAGSVVKDSEVYNCGDDGIQAGANCVIRNNVCTGNSFGIFIPTAASGTVVEANMVIDNTTSGIEASTGLIIGNREYGSSNGFNFSGSSRYGPIITAVAGVVTSAHPHASFEF